MPVYNTIAEKVLLPSLRAKADGITVVPMKAELSKATLQVTSEVNSIYVALLINGCVNTIVDCLWG